VGSVISEILAHVHVQMASELKMKMSQTWAVPWLEVSVTGPLPRNPGFSSWQFHVRFVGYKLSLGQDFLRVLWFSSVSTISLMLHTNSLSPTPRSRHILTHSNRHTHFKQNTHIFLFLCTDFDLYCHALLVGARDFSLLQNVHSGSGTRRAYRGCLPGLK
jgi:hypothetical protein